MEIVIFLCLFHRVLEKSIGKQEKAGTSEVNKIEMKTCLLIPSG